MKNEYCLVFLLFIYYYYVIEMFFVYHYKKKIIEIITYQKTNFITEKKNLKCVKI